MFTGLIQELGLIEDVTLGAVRRLGVRIAKPASPLVLGESIALDGVCLTVVKARGGRFTVEIADETLRRSTAGEWNKGDKVNIERAMSLGDRMGGHIVLGHVDGVARILGKRPEGDSVFVEFELPDALAAFFVEKGSVCIDGVSLTVASLGAKRFGVALIPETLKRTSLGPKATGARVNLEADIIGKYVARLVGKTVPLAASVDEESLRRAGFA
jgi:riboflavin synthase